jgi:gliding motility-associated lipoprotein GldD
MIMRRIILISIIFAVLISLSCHEEVVPKPKGYFRIDFPVKSYSRFSPNCPFSFEIPNYSSAEPILGVNSGKCWYNIQFKEFNATLHLSYYDGKEELKAYISGATNLAYKHSIKADAIDEQLIRNNDHNIYGIMYRISGNAASPVQFFLTDSVSQFFRGSLYFNSVPNKDSLAPVIDFLLEDVNQMISSFQWKK